METSEETMRMERVRTCIFRLMLALSVVDLSAHSEEAAQRAIASWAMIVCSPNSRLSFQQFSNDEIEEACTRVAVCLGHTHIALAQMIRSVPSTL
jgi:hypothetical protein